RLQESFPAKILPGKTPVVRRMPSDNRSIHYRSNSLGQSYCSPGVDGESLEITSVSGCASAPPSRSRCAATEGKQTDQSKQAGQGEPGAAVDRQGGGSCRTTGCPPVP